MSIQALSVIGATTFINNFRTIGGARSSGWGFWQPGLSMVNRNVNHNGFVVCGT